MKSPATVRDAIAPAWLIETVRPAVAALEEVVDAVTAAVGADHGCLLPPAAAENPIADAVHTRQPSADRPGSPQPA